jgi:hypothetical protein
MAGSEPAGYFAINEINLLQAFFLPPPFYEKHTNP